MLRSIAGEWYEWIGEIVAVGLVVAVAAGEAPPWTLALGGLLLLRPLSRLGLSIVRGTFEGL